MPLRLQEHWLWDFWFAQDGDEVHVFYLQAPRSLGDPELRHHNATIGHGVSRDLRTWEVLPDALAVGALGEFDDLATWTGSVIRHEGRWHLFYTGISRAQGHAVQRIGLAISDDLAGWEKHGVVLEADPRWYATVRSGAPEEYWRDPWVEWDAESRCFHMLLTAHANRGPDDARGVIAHATSTDLRSWEAGPPLSSPGEFHQLEVPQHVHLGGRWRILFSATQHDHGVERRGRVGVVAESGTHYLAAEEKWGHYALDRDDFLVGDTEGRHYAGRMLRHRGEWCFFAWEMWDGRVHFAGQLSDPMPVVAEGDGSLRVERP